MKNPLIIALLTICTATAAAAQCNNFDCAYKEAQQLLNSSEKDKYTKAMAYLEDAENFAGADKAQYEKVRALRKKAFVAIEKERKAAVEAREEVKKQYEMLSKERQRIDMVFEDIKNHNIKLFSMRVNQFLIIEEYSMKLMTYLQQKDSLDREYDEDYEELRYFAEIKRLMYPIFDFLLETEQFEKVESILTGIDDEGVTPL